MRHLYFRCNSGHYFEGEACPWDGWTRPFVQTVLEVTSQIRLEGEDLTLALLSAKGVPEIHMQRIILIEFGNSNSAFEAVSPDRYFVNGRSRRLQDLDRNFS